MPPSVCQVFKAVAMCFSDHSLLPSPVCRGIVEQTTVRARGDHREAVDSSLTQTIKGLVYSIKSQ